MEASPKGTFLRGEGLTLQDAEDACWVKYQRALHCAGGGEHGPFEARQYENGAGFCVKCGAWFSRVLPPTLTWVSRELACSIVAGTYGDAIVISRWWSGLVADVTARLLAEADGSPAPEPTCVPPTTVELETLRREFDEPLDLTVLGEVLDQIAAVAGEKD